jgi:hypothetical protein
MLVFLFFLFNVVDGISLAKMHNSSNFAKIPVAKMDNSDLISQILASKGDRKALLGVLADADPAKVNQILTLLRALLADSQSELAALISSSNTADSNYDDAVAAHNAAVVAQSNGVVQLQDALDAANTAAQATYDQGSTALQDAVDAAQVVVDTTSTAKNTANGVLAADRSRLDSEIATLIQVIALMEGLLGLNTFSPTSSPTTTGDGYIDLSSRLGMGECIDTTRTTMLALGQGYISGARGDLDMAETGCKSACTSMNWCIGFYIEESEGSCRMLAQDANYVKDNGLYPAGYEPDGVGFWTSTDVVIDMNRVGGCNKCKCFVKQV